MLVLWTRRWDGVSNVYTGPRLVANFVATSKVKVKGSVAPSSTVSRPDDIQGWRKVEIRDSALVELLIFDELKRP